MNVVLLRTFQTIPKSVMSFNGYKTGQQELSTALEINEYQQEDSEHYCSMGDYISYLEE
jgi:hypothetical protein